MARGAACLSNSNTRIIVCQIVTYVIIVRQSNIRIYRFLILKFVVKLQVLCDLVVVVVCFFSQFRGHNHIREVCDSSDLS